MDPVHGYSVDNFVKEEAEVLIAWVVPADGSQGSRKVISAILPWICLNRNQRDMSRPGVQSVYY